MNDNNLSWSNWICCVCENNEEIEHQNLYWVNNWPSHFYRKCCKKYFLMIDDDPYIFEEVENK